MSSLGNHEKTWLQALDRCSFDYLLKATKDETLKANKQVKNVVQHDIMDQALELKADPTMKMIQTHQGATMKSSR